MFTMKIFKPNKSVGIAVHSDLQIYDLYNLSSGDIISCKFQEVALIITHLPSDKKMTTAWIVYYEENITNIIQNYQYQVRFRSFGDNIIIQLGFERVKESNLFYKSINT